MTNSKYISEKEKEELMEIVQMLEKAPQDTRATIKGFLLGAECVEQALKENKQTA